MYDIHIDVVCYFNSYPFGALTVLYSAQMSRLFPLCPSDQGSTWCVLTYTLYFVSFVLLCSFVCTLSQILWDSFTLTVSSVHREHQSI